MSEHRGCARCGWCPACPEDTEHEWTPEFHETTYVCSDCIAHARPPRLAPPADQTAD